MDSMIEPRVVEPARGVAWWGEGFHLFKSNVWTWVGIMVVYIIISMLIKAVPFVGEVGTWLLTPVFAGGLMLGCRSIERDGTLRMAHLFEGFQGSHFVPLMIIGVVNIVLALAIAAITASGAFGFVKLTDMTMEGADPLGALTEMAGAMTGLAALAILLVLVIVAVFAMLNWFAPALVALRGATAVEAMKLSFSACLRNWVPFLVYGAVGIAVMVAAGLALFGIVLVLGAGAYFGGRGLGMAAIFGVVVLFLVGLAFALVIGPIIFGSTYASYKDTLGEGETALANPAYK
jgi:uncharacterized membrane protein